VPSFLGSKSRCAFGQPPLFLAGNRMIVVVFEKEVSLKVEAYLAKRFFDSAEVLNLRKILNIYKWKKKEYSVVFLVDGEKFKFQNLPSRTSSLLCSAAKQKHFVNRKV